MRKTRALAAAGAAVAVLGVAAPVAVADGGRVANPSNIVAQPGVIARGGQLTITVDGCPHGGHATSNAFQRTNLTPVNNRNDIARGNDTARGTATIDDNARPGPYDITVHCSGRSLTRPAAFTVIGGVRGGIGGSSTGATPTDMAIGGSLVAAAVAGSGFFWMRRRAEKRI
ncbi:hypothetical protein NC658_11635 [Streptomyces griseoincarnatus]|uniref:Integral membrane protein n=1 Tax=Streptomyces griseoincarnatus TaxID=29305 RepID=A0ABT0VSE4_STRGI|nr:hypothetical protein [Streptomyces griseoincarnatus]MCM2513905.1 hypothetical protein [Streptomyces griseoincarnatus]